MRCPVWSTPPAAPPWAIGTDWSARVWFGEITSPEPSPATSIGGAIAQPTEWFCTSCTASPAPPSPIATSTSPAAISGRPTRMTKRPPTAAETAEPTANGVSERPAWRAL